MTKVGNQHKSPQNIAVEDQDGQRGSAHSTVSPEKSKTLRRIKSTLLLGWATIVRKKA
jgi:hypothetical protein